MTARKVFEKMLAGSRNIRFEDFCKVAVAFGYRLDRIRGSHQVYDTSASLAPVEFAERP
jgi:hypothetical protein